MIVMIGVQFAPCHVHVQLQCTVQQLDCSKFLQYIVSSSSGADQATERACNMTFDMKLETRRKLLDQPKSFRNACGATRPAASSWRDRGEGNPGTLGNQGPESENGM